MSSYLKQLRGNTDRLLAVPFQSVERASKSRKQAQEDWSKRTSRGETGLLSLARLIADRVFACPLEELLAVCNTDSCRTFRIELIL